MRFTRARLLSIISVGVFAALVAVAGIAFANRQYIQDVVAASQYEPSTDMQRVIERVAFTDAGSIMFRASKPTLDATQGFNEQCAAVIHRESDQVVGCYTGSNIHLFQISDERLDGMVEVTAAHELLHAAYQRLSASERTQIGLELEREYERLQSESPALAERMSVYNELDDDAFVNELHSVLGTEVANLSPALEEHYSRYFANRTLLLTLFDQYNGYFLELDAQRSALHEQLDALSADISAHSSAYEVALATFNADAQRFSERNERFEFSDNPNDFYTIRQQLESRRNQLENDRLSLNKEIEQYNTLRDQLIELDGTAEDLFRSINSSFAPAATP